MEHGTPKESAPGGTARRWPQTPSAVLTICLGPARPTADRTPPSCHEPCGHPVGLEPRPAAARALAASAPPWPGAGCAGRHCGRGAKACSLLFLAACRLGTPRRTRRSFPIPRSSWGSLSRLRGHGATKAIVATAAAGWGLGDSGTQGRPRRERAAAHLHSLTLQISVYPQPRSLVAARVRGQRGLWMPDRCPRRWPSPPLGTRRRAVAIGSEATASPRGRLRRSSRCVAIACEPGSSCSSYARPVT